MVISNLILFGSIIAFLSVSSKSNLVNQHIFKENFSFSCFYLCVEYDFLIQTPFKFVVSSHMLLPRLHFFIPHQKVNNDHSELSDCWNKILASKGI